MADLKVKSTNNTVGRCYIVELRPPFPRLEIQFIPAEISLDSIATNSKIEVVNRNNPLYHYTGGEDKLKLQLDFYSDEPDRKDVIRKVNWLRSLRGSDGSFGPKRNISIVFGDLFRKDIWIIDSVNTKLSLLDGQFGYLPRQAYVDISLSLDPNKNLRINDIRSI